MRAKRAATSRCLGSRAYQRGHKNVQTRACPRPLHTDDVPHILLFTQDEGECALHSVANLGEFLFREVPRGSAAPEPGEGSGRGAPPPLVKQETFGK